MRTLSLCSGVGALDAGLGIADPHHTVACYVEREGYAAEVLARRQQDGSLPVAPIHGDITTFDGSLLRGRVDGVAAALPCQPYSLAGQRRGNRDDRALWPHFVRIVEECEPGWVFLENTPAFRKHFEPVWGHLRELGFRWAPPLLHTASESGAPHIRRRFYALAAHPGRVSLRLESGRECGEGRPPAPESRHARDEAPEPHGRGCPGQWSGWVFDSKRATLRHDANGRDHRCRICGTYWEGQSPALRVDAGTPDWMDRLRAAGNVGAPPVVYASAFISLVEALAGDPAFSRP